ncbi:hypothetical protein VTO42DRAFT_4759 [Malbranchea cinnamomea]
MWKTWPVRPPVADIIRLTRLNGGSEASVKSRTPFHEQCVPPSSVGTLRLEPRVAREVQGPWILESQWT